ncbi:MAG: alkaline phosphatase [Candidatus Sumerlaeia bacterium]
MFRNRCFKIFSVIALIVILVSSVGAHEALKSKTDSASAIPKYKNIIFMIPDGCSQSIQTLARWYKGEDLTLDSMNCGMLRTDMANSVITGSGAAGTAFATGHKTTVRFLGVGPRDDDLLSTFDDYDPKRAYAPMATILELAKMMYKSTGLVATSRITHATPAAFACHIFDRGLDNEIMEHMVYNNLTVALGGGRRHLLPISEGGKRTDAENLEQVLIERGYEIVTTRDELMSISPNRYTKLWGAFDMSHLAPEMDREKYFPTQPSLAEMTEKAIDVLSQNPRGFFLMVEGSQVDWAGHNNDIGYMLNDFIEFDEAVKVAVEFAKNNGNTLVVAFADHNTGGMKIGHYYTSMGYTNTKVEDLINPIKGMQISANALVGEMGGDYSEANMIAKIKEFWGLDATPDDIAEINDLAASVGMSYALARVICKNHTVIGWTTHGHTGEDVPVWMYPQEKAIGAIDNTVLPLVSMCWQGVGPDALDHLTRKLYKDVEDAFPGNWELDNTDPENPVLVIKGKYRMPTSKDIINIPGLGSMQIGSLVVYAPTRDIDGNVIEDRVFIPRTAVMIIRFCERFFEK